MKFRSPPWHGLFLISALGGVIFGVQTLAMLATQSRAQEWEGRCSITRWEGSADRPYAIFDCGGVEVAKGHPDLHAVLAGEPVTVTCRHYRGTILQDQSWRCEAEKQP